MVLLKVESYFCELDSFALYLDRSLLQFIPHLLPSQLPRSSLCQLCIDFPHCFTRLFNWWLDVCDTRSEEKYGNQLCNLTFWWHYIISDRIAVPGELDFPCLVVVCVIWSIGKFPDSLCGTHFPIPYSILLNIIWFPKLLL